MRKGVEIVPEENYRLRNEDNYSGSERSSGASTSSTQSTAASQIDKNQLSSFQNDFPEGYSEDHGFREASQTLYARAGDKKVGL